MDPLEYLKAIRRRWPVAVLAVLVALPLGWLGSSGGGQSLGQPLRTYRATAILMNLGSASSSSPTSGITDLRTFAALTTVGDVPVRAAKSLSYKGSPETLASSINATAQVETGLLTITATSTERDKAARVADTFAAELLRFLRRRSAATMEEEAEEIQSAMSRLRKDISRLDAEIAGASGGRKNLLTAERDAKVQQFALFSEQYQQLLATPPSTGGLQLIQDASSHPIAVSSKGFAPPQGRAPRLLLAGILGLLVGIGMILALERFDTKIRTKEAGEKHFGLPVLAEVPPMPRRQRGRPLTEYRVIPAGDAFQMLATSLSRPVAGLAEPKQGRDSGRETQVPVAVEVSGSAKPTKAIPAVSPPPPDQPGRGPGEGTPASTLAARGAPRTILVTSSGPGEGKSTVAASLATTFAQLGKRVTVISCDFRRPGVHLLFEVPNNEGLSEALETPSAGSLLDGHLKRTAVRGVSLVPSGLVTERAGLQLGSEKMRRVLAEARVTADVVILDTPPLLAASEAALLLNAVDAVLVVCRAGRTTIEVARRTGEVLQRLEAPAAGVVLNMATETPRPGRGRYRNPYDPSTKGFPRMARHWRKR